MIYVNCLALMGLKLLDQGPYGADAQVDDPHPHHATDDPGPRDHGQTVTVDQDRDTQSTSTDDEDAEEEEEPDESDQLRHDVLQVMT